MVDGWTPEQLTYAPTKESWCALQIFDHLIKTETAIRESCEKRLGEPVTYPPIGDRLRGKGVIALFHFPVRVAVPKTVSLVQPACPASFQAVADAWAEERGRWQKLLGGLSPQTLGVVAMRHPVAGAMSFRDALKFLSVHLLHHRYQLNRLRHLIFPKGAPPS